MTATILDSEARELLERAMKLPLEQRHGIAHELLLESDADRAALKAELTRRWERLRSGTDIGIPADEVVAKLFQRAGASEKSP